MERQQFNEEAIYSLIDELGVEEMKGFVKEAQKRRKKKILREITTSSENFCVRMPSDYLGWYKHYFKDLGKTSISALMAYVLIQYIDRHIDEYPMLPHFGKRVQPKHKPGPRRRVETPENFVPANLHAFKL